MLILKYIARLIKGKTITTNKVHYRGDDGETHTVRVITTN